MTTATRDAQGATARAEARLESAQRVADAVGTYHAAADRIDAAEAQLSDSRSERNNALRVLRAEGVRISDVVDLTGMSASRVRALGQEEKAA